jgi:hypothetical protein
VHGPDLSSCRAGARGTGAVYRMLCTFWYAAYRMTERKVKDFMLKKMHTEVRELQCVLGILGRRRSLPGKANPSLLPLEYHEAGSWFTHLRT